MNHEEDRRALLKDAIGRWKDLADREGLTIVDADAKTITVNDKMHGRSMLISKRELYQIVDPRWPFQLAKQRLIEGHGFRA